MSTRHPYPLPDFDDREVERTQLRVTGTSDTPTRAVHLGEKVVVLASCRVEDVKHKEMEDGGLVTLARSHTGKAIDVFVLDDEEGFDLLSIERERQRALRRTDDATQREIPGVADMSTCMSAERLASELRHAAQAHVNTAGKLRDKAEGLDAMSEQFRADHPELVADHDQA